MASLQGVRTTYVILRYVCISFANDRPPKASRQPWGCPGDALDGAYTPLSCGLEAAAPKAAKKKKKTYTHLTGSRAPLTTGSLVTSGCLLPTPGWQPRPGKVVRAKHLFPFERTGSRSFCPGQSHP